LDQKTMKALVYRGPSQNSLDEMPAPVIQEPTDAILNVTTSTMLGFLNIKDHCCHVKLIDFFWKQMYIRIRSLTIMPALTAGPSGQL